MSVLIVGTVAFDSIKTPFGERKRIIGGSATYSSISASYFSPVRLVAVVGKDFPSEQIKMFNSKKIDTKGLEVTQGKTFHWAGEYGIDFSDPKTIATDLNVLASFDPKIPQEYRDSKFVFLANIDPDLQYKVLKQVKNPKLIACDTMNFWIQSKKKSLLKVIKKVDLFLLNESEAKLLTGEANIVKAAKSIIRLGAKKVIIKKGEHGSLLFSKDGAFCVPAYLLEDIYDPTGAGDTFAGGIMGYLAKSNSTSMQALRKAVVHGNIMATFTVEDFSINRLTSIKKSDIDRRLKKFEKITRF